MKLPIDGFLLALFAALGLAWLAPELGAQLTALRVNEAAVALIFFLQGLSLAPEALRAGAMHGRLHALVQASTFVLFPLIGYALSGLLPATVRGGVLFLCALPSTVSSSVALTAVARGNVPAAVFNASLSNVLGVVATPFWMRLLLETGDARLPLGQVVLDLVLWLIVPLACGQLLRPLLGGLVARHKPTVGKLDRVSILLLVYTSFSHSVRAGVWQAHGASTTLIAGATALVLLAMALCITASCARALAFDRPDRITAVFCGSKKTLAAGVPMAQLIFGAGPSSGLILLPLLAYHTLQLVVCSALAARWAQGSAALIGGDAALAPPKPLADA